MEELRSKVKRCGKGVVAEASSAHAVAGLNHDDLVARCADALGGGHSGDPRADHDHVGVATDGRGGSCGTSGREHASPRKRRAQEASARQRRNRSIVHDP